MSLRDLTGQRFGKLVVIELANQTGIKDACWLCKCDCGNEVIVRGKYMTHGNKRCCGCSQVKHNFIDLTGQRFGKLTVIERADNRIKKDGYQATRWKCRCDCGNEVVVFGNNLRNQQTKSCGCTRAEDLTGQRFGKLTVLKRAEDLIEESGRRRTMWICRCDCGKETLKRGEVLKAGQANSCGCLRTYDLTGQRFGRLEVIKKLEKSYWLCKCDCGNTTNALSTCLVNGYKKSCGCLQKENPNRKTHGLSNTRIYRIYRKIIERCYNENSKLYKNYGGRGITMCEEWLEDFMNFYNWSMANGYSDDLSIDRKNNDKGYFPDNCRWTTVLVQNNNRRSNRIMEYNGETHTIAEWSRKVGIKYPTLRRRIESGWSIEDALFKPLERQK